MKRTSPCLKPYLLFSLKPKKKKPILPINDFEIFNKEFNAIHDRILRDIRGYGLRELLHFEPLEIKNRWLNTLSKVLGKELVNLTQLLLALKDVSY